MFMYYIRTSGIGGSVHEVIAWSCKRNNALIDFESRVSGCNRTWIRDSLKYTKEQILKQRVKELGEVRTVQSEIKPSEVWSMSEKREELFGLLSL